MITFIYLISTLSYQNFTYEMSVDHVRNAPPNCSTKATYRAAGLIYPLEAFGGAMEGDIGNKSLPLVQGSLIPFFGPIKTYNKTVSSTRDLPGESTWDQAFVHAYTPSEIPGIRVEKTGMTPDCSQPDPPPTTVGDCIEPEPNPGPGKIEFNSSKLLDDCLSPLVIDLAHNGFRFSGEEASVYFDLTADGSMNHMTWVVSNGDDAFLVMDHNTNGVVDDGSELFGNGTEMIETGEKALNGFLALAQYDDLFFDGNDDGLISNLDGVWSRLSLWLDENADGVCVPGEMHSLVEMDIVSLEIIPKESRRRDNHGNLLKFWSFVGQGNNKIKMVDVFFKKVI